MSSLERTLHRKQEKEAKKAEKKLAKILNKFDKLPNNCLVCDKEFDKKSKKDAAEWSVVVKPDAVRLYCPECWSMAIDTINKLKSNDADTGDK
tara:strand:+ start:219 stop:497 length:279 start_codon:yes stop_codon:yes gene_type:complete